MKCCRAMVTYSLLSEKKKNKSYQISWKTEFCQHSLKINCDTWIDKLLYILKLQYRAVCWTNCSVRFCLTCCTRWKMKANRRNWLSKWLLFSTKSVSLLLDGCRNFHIQHTLRLHRVFWQSCGWALCIRNLIFASKSKNNPNGLCYRSGQVVCFMLLLALTHTLRLVTATTECTI